MTKSTRHRIQMPLASLDATQLEATLKESPQPLDMTSFDQIDRQLERAEDAISAALHGETAAPKGIHLDRQGGFGNQNPSSPLASLLLAVSAQSTTLDDGRWQFAIETADGTPVLEAEDCENGDLNRLTLLAAVRGLESIDGSAGVTLLSHNRYLIRSLTDSLPRWRRSDFVWDHFGRRVEVQHADLWRRIDHALGIHQVQACLLTARMVSRPLSHDRTPFTDNRSGPASGGRSANSDGPNEWVRTDSAESSIKAPAGAKSNQFSISRPKQPSEASSLSGTNRLRDWVLQSAVDTSHRAQQIAQMGQRNSNNFGLDGGTKAR